jgi:hypothetical protein
LSTALLTVLAVLELNEALRLGRKRIQLLVQCKKRLDYGEWQFLDVAAARLHMNTAVTHFFKVA